MAPSTLFPKDLLDRRRRAFASFEAWAESHPPLAPPEEGIALLGFLRELLPAEARRLEPQGDYSGVRYLHNALSVLGKGE